MRIEGVPGYDAHVEEHGDLERQLESLRSTTERERPDRDAGDGPHPSQLGRRTRGDARPGVHALFSRRGPASHVPGQGEPLSSGCGLRRSRRGLRRHGFPADAPRSPKGTAVHLAPFRPPSLSVRRRQPSRRSRNPSSCGVPVGDDACGFDVAEGLEEAAERGVVDGVGEVAGRRASSQVLVLGSRRGGKVVGRR